VLNEERIGKSAGLLWATLRKNGDEGLFVTQIHKIPRLKGDEAIATPGWLARESKVEFHTGKGKSVTVSLGEINKTGRVDQSRVVAVRL